MSRRRMWTGEKKLWSLLLTLWQPLLRLGSLGTLDFVSFLILIQGLDKSSHRLHPILRAQPMAQRRKSLGDSICGVFPYLMQLLNPFSTPFSWSCWLCLSPDLKYRSRHGMNCTLRCLALSQRNKQIFRHKLFAVSPTIGPPPCIPTAPGVMGFVSLLTLTLTLGMG